MPLEGSGASKNASRMPLRVSGASRNDSRMPRKHSGEPEEGWGGSAGASKALSRSSAARADDRQGSLALRFRAYANVLSPYSYELPVLTQEVSVQVRTLYVGPR